VPVGETTTPVEQRAWGVSLGITQEYCGCWADPYVRRNGEARQLACEKYCVYTSTNDVGQYGNFKNIKFKNCDCYGENMARPRLQNGLRKDRLRVTCDCNGYRLKKDVFPDNSTSWAVYKPTCDEI
jgi:hypothetical protein